MYIHQAGKIIMLVFFYIYNASLNASLVSLHNTLANYDNVIDKKIFVKLLIDLSFNDRILRNY